jgi:hypothetical protein
MLNCSISDAGCLGNQAFLAPPEEDPSVVALLTTAALYTATVAGYLCLEWWRI